jgi:hypothetical protein
LLLGNRSSSPQRFIAGCQILLQLVGEPRRKILALRVGDFATLEDGKNLVLDDIVSDVLAQFRDGAGDLDGDMGDPPGVRNDGAGHDQPPRDRGRARLAQLDLGKLDAFVVHGDRGRLAADFCRRGLRDALRCDASYDKQGRHDRGGRTSGRKHRELHAKDIARSP